MYKSKKTGIIGMIITVFILILLVFLTNINMEKVSFLETAASKLIMPLQNGLTYLKNKLANNNSFFIDINNLKTENEQLKEKNSELEQALRELEMIKAENSILKEYASMKEKYEEFETIPGYIIDKNISNLGETMVINVGKKDGVESNMAVISEQGLVGRIISVTDGTAKVQPIIDNACSVSATLSSSRDNIVVKGTLESENKIKATYIPTEANLVIGDKVETSGQGGIYPKGILIGTLEEVVDTKNITNRYANIKTAVDFSKLETVLVIKNSAEN